MIKLIKIFGVWVVLILSVFVGAWISSTITSALVEIYGILVVVWGIPALAIGGALAFVAWQIVEG